MVERRVRAPYATRLSVSLSTLGLALTVLVLAYTTRGRLLEWVENLVSALSVAAVWAAIMIGTTKLRTMVSARRLALARRRSLAASVGYGHAGPRSTPQDHPRSHKSHQLTRPCGCSFKNTRDVPEQGSSAMRWALRELVVAVRSKVGVMRLSIKATPGLGDEMSCQIGSSSCPLGHGVRCCLMTAHKVCAS